LILVLVAGAVVVVIWKTKILDINTSRPSLGIS